MSLLLSISSFVNRQAFGPHKLQPCLPYCTLQVNTSWPTHWLKGEFRCRHCSDLCKKLTSQPIRVLRTRSKVGLKILLKSCESCSSSVGPVSSRGKAQNKGSSCRWNELGPVWFGLQQHKIVLLAS